MGGGPAAAVRVRAGVRARSEYLPSCDRMAKAAGANLVHAAHAGRDPLGHPLRCRW
jgi:hypothetical protein